MTALAAGTQRPELSDPTNNFGPQKGSTIVYQGGLVMTDASAYLRPAAASVAGSYCVGVYDDPHSVRDRSDATGLADGALTLQYKEGVFGFQNDGGSPILATTPSGTAVYAVDDQTVSLSSNAGARPIAGRLRRLDSSVTGGPVVVEVSESIGRQLYDQSIASSLRPLGGTGHNGAGAATATGAKVGDVVLAVIDLTDGTTITSGFEAAITVADQIQQTSATDYSLKKLLVLLGARS
jgi:hypothetical protein